MRVCEDSDIHIATKAGDIEGVKTALASGKKRANVNTVNDQYGMTALDLAIRCGRSHNVNLFIDEGVTGDAQYGCQAALMWATDTVSADIVELLLGAGATPGSIINQVNISLIRATARSKASVVDLLLGTGGTGGTSGTGGTMDVNTVDCDGHTTLMCAASFGRTRCIKLLLATNGIDVNAVNNRGYTALMLASMNCHTECVNMLLTHTR